MLGNEEDFTSCLGFEVKGIDKDFSLLDVSNFKKMIETAVRTFPGFRVIAPTLRSVKTAGINDWGPYAGLAVSSIRPRFGKTLKSLTALVVATALHQVSFMVS